MGGAVGGPGGVRGDQQARQSGRFTHAAMKKTGGAVLLMLL